MFALTCFLNKLIIFSCNHSPWQVVTCPQLLLGASNFYSFAPSISVEPIHNQTGDPTANIVLESWPHEIERTLSLWPAKQFWKWDCFGSLWHFNNSDVIPTFEWMSTRNAHGVWTSKVQSPKFRSSHWDPQRGGEQWAETLKRQRANATGDPRRHPQVTCSYEHPCATAPTSEAAGEKWLVHRFEFLNLGRLTDSKWTNGFQVDPWFNLANLSWWDFCVES